MSKIPVSQFRSQTKHKPVSYAARNQTSKRYHDQFVLQCKAHGLPDPVPEYKFHPIRKWRFDFAWFDDKAEVYVAMEIEGGLFVNGRHSRGRTMINDMEKYNNATLLGWKVYRFSTDEIKNGEAVKFMKGALGL